MMLIISVYVFSLLLIYLLPLVRKDFGSSKKPVLIVHVATAAILLTALLLWHFTGYGFYGSWTLPIISLVFLVSGSLLIVLYWKTKYWFIKVYSGFFYFYPLLAILAAFMSRLFAVIVIIIPLALLFKSDTLGTGNGMSIKHEFNGVMGSSEKIMLYESYFPLEKKTGVSYMNLDVVSGLKIDHIDEMKTAGDSIIVFYNGHKQKVSFLKIVK